MTDRSELGRRGICGMTGCGKPGTDTVSSPRYRDNALATRNMIRQTFCREHARYWMKCERSFAPLRKLLIEKYSSKAKAGRTHEAPGGHLSDSRRSSARIHRAE